jgi:predicted helicase
LTTIRKADVSGDWDFAFVTSDLMVHHALSMKEGNYVFPLLLQDEKTTRENLSADVRVYLDERFSNHFSIEEVLGFIYSVLYSPTYRSRYAEFLRIDFPRIPFPEKSEDFEALSELGWELVQAHLLKEYPDAGLGKYHGKGDGAVEAVRYTNVKEAEQTIWINKTQGFRPVPEDVWNFHIGGYQVLDKYLKSRKGRQLSLDEINHVAAIADSLAFTITQMGKIDEAYKTAFPDRG